jgi:hypothetical protein
MRITSRPRTGAVPGRRSRRRLAFGLERAAVECDPLAHSDQAVSGAVDADRPAVAVVDDVELERALPVADGDLGGGASCVLDHVRQCFLHDAVGGEVDPGRQVHGLALDPQLQ